MTFLQARNEIVYRLEQHLGCRVDLSDQIAEQPDYPYSYYSVLSSRSSDHAFGLHETVRNEDGSATARRSERASATMSFTFCSQNRETEAGEYIFGEDEALELAERAHGFFLLNAHNIHTDAGDIVINNVGPVASRSGFLVTDTVRRFGFDIRFNYIRVDEMPSTTVLEPGKPRGEVHS